MMISLLFDVQLVWGGGARSCVPTSPIPGVDVDPALPAKLGDNLLNCCGFAGFKTSH